MNDLPAVYDPDAEIPIASPEAPTTSANGTGRGGR